MNKSPQKQFSSGLLVKDFTLTIKNEMRKKKGSLLEAHRNSLPNILQDEAYLDEHK